MRDPMYLPPGETAEWPVGLWTFGDVGLLADDLRHVAIVGTREPSAYGALTAKGLASSLVKRGVVVVSGLARGIDSAAHWGALHGDGPTIAVLPSPVDSVYPRSNRHLYEAIVNRGGLIVSEYPSGTAYSVRHFFERNLVIVKLAREGTVIVESKIAGGAMNAAIHAVRLGRPLYAFPGPTLREVSAGPNELIRSGRAKAISSVEDLA